MSACRVAIVASHVIQYQDPFFRLLAAEPQVDLTVFYCSPHGAQPYRDEDMKTTLQWDLELLEGYRHHFLRNFGGNPNGGYFRHFNPGIVPALLRGRFDAVIFFTGWGTLSALLGMLTCHFFRIPSFLYGDSSMPPPVTTPRAALRAGLLRTLFGLTTGFMVSGLRNAEFYAHYGADPRTFFLLPWAIDNDRFAAAASMTTAERAALRARYGISPGTTAILFSAKLVARKDPLTLLRAYQRMRRGHDAALLFMGDGELRTEMERFVRERALPNVIFLGFINQREIPHYYAMSDVFVLPSTYEPRGAVINEAMACGLPVIVTDRCGSVGDIVQDGENGFVFTAGDDIELSGYLDALTSDRALRTRMSECSRRLIGSWDFARGVSGVKEMLRWVTTR